MEYEYTWKSYKTPQEVLEFLRKHDRDLGYWGYIKAKQREERLEFKMSYHGYLPNHFFYNFPILKGYMMPDESGCTIYANEVFNKENYLTIAFLVILISICIHGGNVNNVSVSETARICLTILGCFGAGFVFYYSRSRRKKLHVELMEYAI